MPAWKKTLAQSALKLLFPPACLGCDNPLVRGEEWICLNCHSNLPRTRFAWQPENPVYRAFMGRLPVERAASYLHFYKGGIVQALMHELKYRSQPDLGLAMGHWAAQDCLASGFFSGIDGLIPVPLHPRKMAIRGYNQAEKLASGLSEVTGIPVLRDHLYRREVGATQTHKGRFERWLNVQTTFALRDSAPLRYQHFLLIDDVLTTGATLEGCARPFETVPGVDLSVFTWAKARH